ncbi:serine/threonine-protein kinase [Schaalia suimastitidis]|uniref:serine/threonine-protein kinase n=1 Tax=Schaalia suimastitidis TaxID=121163 RepID=UPI00047E5C17|nr:serine/threonine-protein kinase [Schaalia suimastitidis]
MTSQGAVAPELNGYTWVRLLGSGGFADVHLYRQHVPARDVAIKVARFGGESSGIRELRREANAMATVAGHPAVVELFSAGTAGDGRPYLVMEYCPVANIGAQVRARPMAVDRAIDTIIRLCGGVEMMHRSGLVHRDIKPGNVMLDSYGKPVLGDFGVAAEIGMLSPGGLDGFSVLWAPPEQQHASTHAHPTQDVWALAATLWTLLVGRSPFEDPVGDNSAVAIATRVRSGALRALGRGDAPPHLEVVLREAMRVDPLTRTPSAFEFGRALQQVQEIMGRQVTQMELRDLPIAGRGGVPGGLSADSFDDATRLRGIASIDAERTRVSDIPVVDFAAHVPSVVEDQWTVREVTRDPIDDRRNGSVSQTKHRRSLLTVLLLVVLGAVIAAGLIVAMLTGGGGIVLPTSGDTSPAEESLEDIAAPAPAPVRDISGVVQETEIHWTWKRGEAVPGEVETVPTEDTAGVAGADEQIADIQNQGVDETAVTVAGEVKTYLYTVTRPDGEEVTRSVNVNYASTEAMSGEHCIEVIAVGESGRQSSPASTCIQVP